MDKMICELIRGVFWNAPIKKHTHEEWAEAYKEVKDHRIELLFIEALKTWDVPVDIKNTWRLECFATIAHNVQLLSLQREIHELLIKEDIEYSILKGSSVAVYYPNPLYRTAGDIDIIVKDKDFERAYALFCHFFGAPSIGSKHNGEIREYVYMKDFCAIELHQSYSILADKDYDRILDSWIKEDIHNYRIREIEEKYQFCIPSEIINGLVLLAHIAQHLEGGLGLRQILDWMMYVNKCLQDEKWPAFQDKAQEIGLEKLAITTTRMCQDYLGLPVEKIHWTKNVDFGVCDELMEFVLACGNFGRKEGTNNTVAMIVSQNQGVISLFRNLQQRGASNWIVLRKYPFLRPLAWIYQGCRYLRKGIEGNNSLVKIKKGVSDGIKRNALLNKLGIKNMKKTIKRQ